MNGGRPLYFILVAHCCFRQAVVQVPLNGDAEYDGGRLVFYQTTPPTTTDVDDDGGMAASTPRWVVPQRPAGSCTVHDQFAVHGVTELVSGVRYGLYVLI
jgi:hypothetical protein